MTFFNSILLGAFLSLLISVFIAYNEDKYIDKNKNIIIYLTEAGLIGVISGGFIGGYTYLVVNLVSQACSVYFLKNSLW